MKWFKRLLCSLFGHKPFMPVKYPTRTIAFCRRCPELCEVTARH